MSYIFSHDDLDEALKEFARRLDADGLAVTVYVSGRL